MELWFTEYYSNHARFSMRVSKQLYSGESPFQRIDVLETQEYGRVLVIDGFIMLTERDEFIYHEMISHVPMAVHPNPRKVAVVGGGDGGTVRELVRYPDVERIDLIEIDQLVVDVCREFFPSTTSGLSDPRVNVYYADGVQFMGSCQDKYDLIIVDSTDPIGPGEGLFTREFYQSCFKALAEDGIMVNQHEGAFYDDDVRACQRAHARISEVFPISKVYQANIPTYASGYWLFGFASKKLDPIEDLREEEWEKLGISTRHYTTSLHKGAFALPAYVEKLLAEVRRR
ncbi:MAG: spermidine synthase [Peptococcaceae bacterium 1109]|nr:MAG: spermidine synthase [Peptococcaceae bacterium 1109]